LKFNKCFEIVNGKKYKKLNIKDLSEGGLYPIISAAKFNGGIINYTDDETNDLINGNCFTIGIIGGYLHYQEKPFYSNGNILILKPKIKFNYLLNKHFITLQLSSIVEDKYMSIGSILDEISIWIYM